MLISNVKPDKRGTGYIAFVEWKDYKGTMFEVPPTLKKGNRVTMKVTRIDGNTLYGRYQK